MVFGTKYEHNFDWYKDNEQLVGPSSWEAKLGAQHSWKAEEGMEEL